MAKVKVTNVQWNQKSEEEKEQLYRKFMCGSPKKRKEVLSTDRMLRVPRTPKVSKKPGQKKRLKHIRTRTKL